MPTLTRWHLKAGLIYFVLALLLGLGFRLQPVADLPEQIHNFRPLYYHFLMVGWITQIIIGVSIWMFPRASREYPRGDARLGWATFYLLNAGLLLRLFSEPFVNEIQTDIFAIMLFFSGLFQWGAALLYTLNIWSRVKLK